MMKLNKTYRRAKSELTRYEIVVCMMAALEKMDKPTQKIITEMVQDLARQLPNVSVSCALELLLGIGAMEGRG